MNRFIKYAVLIAVVLSFGIALTKTIQARYTPVDVDSVNSPVVIELFTSQSCSSCPPADALLQEINQNPNVIALGYHVTYWDHLNWKDTLSHEFATQRQREYAAQEGSGRVYTPQMIVDGEHRFVGSNRAELNSALQKHGEVKVIKITENAQNLTIALPEMETGEYSVYLAGIKKHHQQSIPSGENTGRTVDYVNTVLALKKLEDWDGTKTQITASKITDEGIDGYVILAQKGTIGTIIAAGKL